MVTRRSFAAVMFALLARRAHAAAVPANSRLAYTCDGNFYDRDDWGSAPMSIKLLADAGQLHRLVHFDYNSHIPQSSGTWEKAMIESCKYAPNRYNCRAGRSAAVGSLRAAIAAGTASNPLTLLLAGPPDTLWDALQGVSMATRQHTTVISHSSSYNETTGGVHTLGQCTGVRVEKIPNQNQRLNTKQNWGPWAWLRNTDQWLYNRMRASGRADVSDSGMMYYVLYGNKTPTVTDYRNKLQS